MTTADLVVRNARVRTLDPRRPAATALAVTGGHISAVGDDGDVRNQLGRHTQVIDLAGAAVTPGWRDSHAHPVLGADLTVGLDLTGCTDRIAVRSAVAAALADTDGWLLGWGLLPDVFPDGRPHRDDIDDLAGGRPVVLRMFDSHSALASSAALARAGIHGPRAFATDSSIVCEAGVPTGFLLESEAVDLVYDVAPDRSVAERAVSVRRVLDSMAAAGLVAVNVMDAMPGSEEILTIVEDAGELAVRLRLAPWCPAGSGADTVDELIRRQRTGGRRWRIGGVKFFLDGTIDGGTAWLSRPDVDGTSARSYWPDPADYSAAVTTLARAGVGTSTHAIGDAAVTHAARTLAGLRELPTAHRHSIEHLEMMTDQTLAAVARSGAVASMQPTHCTLFVDAGHEDNWSRRLGDERADLGWRIGDVHRAGITTVLGSDWPVAPYDMRSILAAARLRRTPGRHDQPVLGARQAIDASTALDCVTRHPARAARDGSGQLGVGEVADLTAIAVDPVDAPGDELAEAPILLTVSGGTVTHRAQ